MSHTNRVLRPGSSLMTPLKQDEEVIAAFQDTIFMNGSQNSEEWGLSFSDGQQFLTGNMYSHTTGNAGMEADHVLWPPTSSSAPRRSSSSRSHRIVPTDCFSSDDAPGDAIRRHQKCYMYCQAKHLLREEISEGELGAHGAGDYEELMISVNHLLQEGQDDRGFHQETAVAFPFYLSPSKRGRWKQRNAGGSRVTQPGDCSLSRGFQAPMKQPLAGGVMQGHVQHLAGCGELRTQQGLSGLHTFHQQPGHYPPVDIAPPGQEAHVLSLIPSAASCNGYNQCHRPSKTDNKVFASGECYAAPGSLSLPRIWDSGEQGIKPASANSPQGALAGQPSTPLQVERHPSGRRSPHQPFVALHRTPSGLLPISDIEGGAADPSVPFFHPPMERLPQKTQNKSPRPHRLLQFPPPQPAANKSNAATAPSFLRPLLKKVDVRRWLETNPL